MINSEIVKAIIYAITIPCFVVIIGKLVDFISGTILKFVFPRFWVFISIYLFAPGVIFHELCHLIVAFISGARIREVHLYKVERTAQGYVLGSVSYSTNGPIILRALQSFLASCAPTVFGLIAIFWLSRYGIFIKPDLWYKALIIYAIACLSVHIDLSDADIKCMLSGSMVVIPLLIVIFYFTKFDPFIYINQFKALIGR